MLTYADVCCVRRAARCLPDCWRLLQREQPVEGTHPASMCKRFAFLALLRVTCLTCFTSCCLLYLPLLRVTFALLFLRVACFDGNLAWRRASTYLLEARLHGLAGSAYLPTRFHLLTRFQQPICWYCCSSVAALLLADALPHTCWKRVSTSASPQACATQVLAWRRASSKYVEIRMRVACFTCT